jgi:MscS family membrane protein
MENREIWETFGIRHEDASKIGSVVRDVKSMLQAHSGIDENKFLMVAFDKSAPSSLDFFVYCLTQTADWIEFHEVKQDVLTRILRTIHSHGAEIALPTSTFHVPNALTIARQTRHEAFSSA